MRSSICCLRLLATFLLGALFTNTSAVASTETPIPAAPPARPSLDPSLPTLFVIGDSTARNGTKGQRGWADEVAPLFETTKINVSNRARGGRSSRTFQTEGLWDAVLADAKPGDIVLIQFGHNDGGPLDDDKRARGSIRGTGEESKEIYNPVRQTQEVVHTFGWYMKKYIADARAKGMHPIVLSYVPRCPKPDATIDATGPAGSYQLWAEETARSEGTPYVDAHRLILTHYATMTPEAVKAAYFSPDNTHTSLEGARRNAVEIVAGLRALPDSPLAAYFTPAATN